jgi:hypothetical protein
MGIPLFDTEGNFIPAYDPFTDPKFEADYQLWKHTPIGKKVTETFRLEREKYKHILR